MLGMVLFWIDRCEGFWWNFIGGILIGTFQPHGKAALVASAVQCIDVAMCSGGIFDALEDKG